MAEKHSRTLVKTLVWRVIATIITMTLVFAYTGKFLLSVGIGFTEVIVKMTGYYIYERVWANVSWGAEKGAKEGVAKK